MQRNALVLTLAVLGTVAVGSGLYAIILGPAFAPGGAPTTSSVDSEYRFVNVFWLAAGAAVWWSLFRLRKRAMVLRTMLVLAFIGGLARVLSAVVAGWPHPVFIASTVLELVIVPLVLWWHVRFVGLRDSARSRTPVRGRPAPARGR